MTNQTPLYTRNFWLLCISSAFFFTSFNIILPELENLLVSIDAYQHLGLVLPLFTVIAMASRPLSGKLVDSIGRKPIMIYGSIVTMVAALFYPFVLNIVALGALRMFHGMSTGFKPTGTSATVADISPADRRGEAMGVLGMANSIGLALGPALGSLITAKFGFNVNCVVSFLFGLISVLVILRIDETSPNSRKIKASDFKINLSDVFDPKALQPAIIMIFSLYAFGVFLTIMPGYTEKTFAVNKGVFFTSYIISSLLIRIVAGKLSDRYGRKIVIMHASIIMALGVYLIAYSTTLTTFIISSLIIGIGGGLSAPSIFGWVADIAEKNRIGRSFSTLYISLELGITLGAFIAGWQVSALHVDYSIIFIQCAGVNLLAFLYVGYLVWKEKLDKRRS